MAIKEIKLTAEGLKNYENELEELKNVKRKEVSEKIKVALSFGDLSENSEYDEAKNEQAKVEARIAELEAMLKNAQIINEDEISSDMVHVGSKVKVLDKEYKEEITYLIVGTAEASPSNGKISDESPIGKALIGSKPGQSLTVETPGGLVNLEVLEIIK